MGHVVAGESPLGNIGTVIFDLDGVVYIDGQGIDGAGAALQQLTDAGLLVLFASNNSTKTPAMAAEHIAAATGYACMPNQAVTSALVTAKQLAGVYGRAHVVGEPGLAATLRDEGIEVVEDWHDAQVVVVGLDRAVTFDALAAATLAIGVGGTAFVATNTDATFPTAEGPVPGGGAIVAAIQAATGVEPVVFGKPNEAFRAVMREMAEGEVLMVGDRAETDIAMGKAEGWATVLVLSGVTNDPHDVPAEYTPDYVLDSIADLPALLGISEERT
jgi:HAD superfamily hydrolase (TIGR01450 family)